MQHARRALQAVGAGSGPRLRARSHMALVRSHSVCGAQGRADTEATHCVEQKQACMAAEPDEPGHTLTEPKTGVRTYPFAPAGARARMSDASACKCSKE